jgi:hypothetical protein
LVTGDIDEQQDHKRIAFSLLQQPFNQELLDHFSTDREVYHLVTQLKNRTTITTPIEYTLSDKTEVAAHDADNSYE